MTEYFELGRILKPQGIKGELKVAAFTDSLERFEYLEFIYFKRGAKYERAEIVQARTDAKYAYIKLAGIGDRDMAESMRGQSIYVDRANAAKLPPGHYYICDLIGMSVIKTDSGKIGVLENILQTGSKDVYVVKLDAGGSLMFPSVEGVILSRDIEKGEMTVDGARLEEVAVYDI